MSPRFLALALAAILAAPPLHAQEAPRPVISEIVSADRIGERIFPGVVEADHETQLAFQTIGRLAVLAVEAGDRVRSGDVLARLDRVTLEEDVAEAEASARAAQASADHAAQVVSRVEVLAERGIASTAQLEAARAGRDAAAAQAEAAQAQLDRAREALGHAVLLAPMDGIVTARHVEVGTVVAAGTPVLTLASERGREAVIDVPAEFAALMQPGTSFIAREHTEDSAAAVPATLRLIEPVANAQLRGRRLRLTLEGAGETLRIGSLVTASLVGSETAVMTLPDTALFADGEAAQVWRVDPASRAVARVDVAPGRRIGDRVEITQGIAEGDEIVVKGVHSLTEGQQVGEREE